jgi:hypothetical protein
VFWSPKFNPCIPIIPPDIPIPPMPPMLPIPWGPGPEKINNKFLEICLKTVIFQSLNFFWSSFCLHFTLKKPIHFNAS